MQITSCPHKQAGTNQCQSPFPRPINVIPSTTKPGPNRKALFLVPCILNQSPQVSEILTSHTVAYTVKNHWHTMGRDQSGHNDKKRCVIRERTVWETFLCNHKSRRHTSLSTSFWMITIDSIWLPLLGPILDITMPKRHYSASTNTATCGNHNHMCLTQLYQQY